MPTADPTMSRGRGVLASPPPAAPAAPQAAPQAGGVNDEQRAELVQLTASRVLQALTQIGRELDTSMKADPIGGAVEMGTRALRQVAMAAQRAGKPLPLEILVAAGILTIRDMASMAQDKGYIGATDADAETFLKEVWQQSMQAYARMDAADGLIDPKQAQQVASQAGAAPAPGPAQQPEGGA